MALIIRCDKCGQDHLRDISCSPENVAWKEKTDIYGKIRDLEKRIKELEDGHK